MAMVTIVHEVTITNTTGTTRLYVSSRGTRTHEEYVSVAIPTENKAFFALKMLYYIHTEVNGDSLLLACGKMRSIRLMTLKFLDDSSHRTRLTPRNFFIMEAWKSVRNENIVSVHLLGHRLRFLVDMQGVFLNKIDGRVHED